MCFVVILLVIISFIIGLSGMKKVDKFISDVKIINNDKKVLIYGDGHISEQVIRNLGKADIGYKLITENKILMGNERGDFLLALSNDDLHNVMLCSLGKKLLEIDNIIAVCNDENNKKLFNEYGAISFESDYICSKEFILMLKEKIESD